jgi:uncharacterized protein (TIGR02594 family)
MTRRLAVGLFCALISTSALISAADAKPRKHRVVRQIEPSNFGAPSFPSFLSDADSVVEKARSYIGAGAVFGRSRLWCARFMNVVLQKSGYHGTGSDMASSFAGNPRTTLQVGAIAVMSRGRRGGHVGIVSGIDAKGNPIIVSGNHGNRVAETVYPRNRVYAYVKPQ